MDSVGLMAWPLREDSEEAGKVEMLQNAVNSVGNWKISELSEGQWLFNFITALIFQNVTSHERL